MQDYRLRCFLDFSSEKQLINDHVNLVEVENKVELTDVPKEVIKDFNHQMNAFEISKLIVVDVDTKRKVESSIAAVNDLVCPPFDEVCETRFPGRDQPVHLLFDFLLLFFIKGCVPFAEPCFSRAVLQQTSQTSAQRIHEQ